MKYLLALAVSFLVIGCNEEPAMIEQGQKNSILQVGLNQYNIREIQWKGHTYGFTDVHGGVSVFHAGHCRCNSVK